MRFPVWICAARRDFTLRTPFTMSRSFPCSFVKIVTTTSRPKIFFFLSTNPWIFSNLPIPLLVIRSPFLIQESNPEEMAHHIVIFRLFPLQFFVFLHLAVFGHRVCNCLWKYLKAVRISQLPSPLPWDRLS